MKTIEEKRKIIKQCEKELIDAKCEASAFFLSKDTDINTMCKFNKRFINAYFSVIRMYTEGLTEAINPISDMTLPALIASLRLLLNELEKRDRSALGVADTLLKSINMNAIPYEMDANANQKYE